MLWQLKMCQEKYLTAGKISNFLKWKSSWRRHMKTHEVFWKENMFFDILFSIFMKNINLSCLFGRETKCGTKHFSQTFNGFDCQQKSQTWLNSSIITWTTVLVFVTITIIICKKLYIFSIHQLDRQLSFCLSWYTLSCLPRWTFSPWNTLDLNIFYWYEITKFKIPSVHNLRVSLHA